MTEEKFRRCMIWLYMMPHIVISESGRDSSPYSHYIYYASSGIHQVIAGFGRNKRWTFLNIGEVEDTLEVFKDNIQKQIDAHNAGKKV